MATINYSNKTSGPGEAAITGARRAEGAPHQLSGADRLPEPDDRGLPTGAARPGLGRTAFNVEFYLNGEPVRFPGLCSTQTFWADSTLIHVASQMIQLRLN